MPSSRFIAADHDPPYELGQKVLQKAKSAFWDLYKGPIDNQALAMAVQFIW
jgi:hypothetical protein